MDNCARAHITKYTPALHARAVAAVLRATDTTTLHALVGHSCGGVVAVALLASGAARATRLALVAAPHPSPRFPARKELLKSPGDRLMLPWMPLAHLVHLVFSVFWPLLRHLPYRTILPARGSATWSILLRVMLAQRRSVGFARISTRSCLRCRTALRCCSMDRNIVPLIHGERLHAALSSSQLKLLADGHYAVLDQGRRSLVDRITSGELSAP
jgi:pimeloyl-ACP methyl ester carboxylesterase